MHFKGFNKNLIKALASLSIILSLASFSGDGKYGIDEMTSQHPVPETIQNSVKNGTGINTVKMQNINARIEVKPNVVPEKLNFLIIRVFLRSVAECNFLRFLN